MYDGRNLITKCKLLTETDEVVRNNNKAYLIIIYLIIYNGGAGAALQMEMMMASRYTASPTSHAHGTSLASPRQQPNVVLPYLPLRPSTRPVIYNLNWIMAIVLFTT